MKKIYILIITIVLLFISFLITLYIPKNYEISYKLDQYEINEKYNKEKKQYTFLVKYEDIEYPFLINHKYTKKQKLIKNINKADKCLSINALDNNYELCTENNKFIINNISDANNKKDLKSLTVLNEFDEKIYAWNYKGYTQIFHNNAETINILNNNPRIRTKPVHGVYIFIQQNPVNRQNIIHSQGSFYYNVKMIKRSFCFHFVGAAICRPWERTTPFSLILPHNVRNIIAAKPRANS